MIIDILRILIRAVKIIMKIPIIGEIIVIIAGITLIRFASIIPNYLLNGLLLLFGLGLILEGMIDLANLRSLRNLSRHL
ncbi:MAG: hypothetical protein QXT03_03395 [Desulfurococcaceae archaeon]